MFFYSYSENICEKFMDLQEKIYCLEIYQNDIYKDKILDKIIFALNIIFTLEAFCIIISKGLIMHKKAYLRSLKYFRFFQYNLFLYRINFS